MKLIRWLTAAEVPRVTAVVVYRTRDLSIRSYITTIFCSILCSHVIGFTGIKKKKKKAYRTNRSSARPNRRHIISRVYENKKAIYFYLCSPSVIPVPPSYRIPVCTEVSNCGPLRSREQYNITICANKHYINTTIIENCNTMAIV